LNKKPRTRPVKSPGERRRREKAQKKRLAALVGDGAVAGMSPLAVREVLKRPARIRRSAAG
jgi:hypothetical protein